MRILFIHTIGKNKYGGGERWVVNAAAGLKRKGHTVFVGCMKNSKLLEKAAGQGLNTVNFNIHSDISPYMAVKISLFLKKNKIDVLISKRRDLAVAGMAAKIGAKPVVLVRSGSPPQSNIRKHIFIIRNLADGILTNTQTIKDFYVLKGLDSKGFIQVIYNGLIINDSVKKYDFSEKYPGKKIVLSVGRLASEKAYDNVIDAAALLKEINSDLVFVILGEGKLRSKLINYARQKGVHDIVHFIGYREPIVSYLKGCNIFLLSSLYEGMPNAAMEAMAYGKPVIMTNVNGAAELSDNGKYALLIPSKNSLAIAEALKKVIKNNEYYEQIATKAKSFVRNKFRMDNMVNEIESFILKKYEKKNNRL